MFQLCMKKRVSVGCGVEEKKKVGEKTTSGVVSPSFLITFFRFLFVSWGIIQAMGELSKGNTDINLP